MTSSDAAFLGRSGIGVFWPFGGPIVADPGDPDTDYAPAEFVFGPLTNGPFSAHVTPKIIGRCRAAGFDHFRIQFHPGPWMQAMRRDDREYLRALSVLFDDMADAVLGAGMGLVMAPTLTGYVRDKPEAILADFAGGAYANYRATLCGIVGRWAHRDPRYLAFELFNEPPGVGLYAGSWAAQFQPDLFEGVRGAAPEHTIVLTGADWSSIEQLTALDPTRFDGNVLWTFHGLIPAPAALQGHAGVPYKYIAHLRYPPMPSKMAAAIRAMAAAVKSDAALTPAEQLAMIAALGADLEYYFTIPEGADWLGHQYTRVSDWCRLNSIRPEDVYVGEFGMTRPGLATGGGAKADRVRLYRDLKGAAALHGFRSSPIHLDTVDFGITSGQDSTIGTFDKKLLSAIFP